LRNDIKIGGEMETRPMTDKIVSFVINSTHIIAMDEKGRMWYRDVPASYSYYNNSNTNPNKEKEKQEEKYIWKPIPMITFVEHEPLPPPREIPPDADNVPREVDKVEKVLPISAMVSSLQQPEPPKAPQQEVISPDERDERFYYGY
jgi:hypothetical protein